MFDPHGFWQETFAHYGDQPIWVDGALHEFYLHDLVNPFFLRFMLEVNTPRVEYEMNVWLARTHRDKLGWRAPFVLPSKALIDGETFSLTFGGYNMVQGRPQVVSTQV